MKAAGLSHPGKCRDNNQDSFSIDLKNKLFIVADGMGGHYGGELASQTAVEVINNYWVKNYSPKESPHYHIREVIYRTNEEIFKHHKNMGTTLEIFTVIESKGWIGHVGDSRIYHLRGDKLELLTTDHTRVRELIESGDLTPEAAKDYPFQHVITKAVGIDELVLPDVLELELKPGDMIIMCSDGLTGDYARYILSEGEMIEILQKETDLFLCCQQLVDIANQKGGPDNITVLIVKIEENDPGSI